MRIVTPAFLTLSALMLVAAPAVPAADKDAAQQVKLEKKDNTIEVTIGGKPFTTYQTSKDLPKPFFAPVRAADGAIITREVGKPGDHPHHKGIWVAVDEVNEVDFWAEKGKIVNHSVELVKPEGNPAKLRVVNHWLGDDGKPVVTETTTIRIFGNRLMIYDIRFSAGDKSVTFDDTKEGLFGIRVANTLRETEGGTIVNAEGLQGSKEAWAKESAWVDYYGPVDGKIYGVAIFDHPLNTRRSRYHVRNYGLFTINPFGTKAYTGGKQPADPLILPPGGTFDLRYGLYVHDGNTTEGQVPETYLEYLKVK